MTETDFKDRVPQYPGRVKMIPVPGEANTYDMERADNPLVEGTPINKATLDSISHSRLTGRFYVSNVENKQKDFSDLTLSPFPLSGWEEVDGDSRKEKNGIYYIETSSGNAGSKALGDTSWTSGALVEHSYMIGHSEKFKVKEMSFTMEKTYASANPVSLNIQGSNDGALWDDLYVTDSYLGSRTYTLNPTEYYLYYRMLIVFSSKSAVKISNFKYALYDIFVSENKYELFEQMPEYFTKGQRLLIQTPETVIDDGVMTNTFNDIPVNTVLLPQRRYELVYNGDAFDVKEV